MRLRQIKEQIEKVLPKMDLKFVAKNTSPATYKLTNVDDAQDVVDTIGDLGLFKKHVKVLEGLQFYDFSGKYIIVSEQEYSLLSSKFNEIKVLSLELLAVLEDIIPKSTANMIAIKIPSPKDFKELRTTIDKLDKIFSQTLINDQISGDFEIANFDTGSYWLDIIVSGVESVSLIAGVAWSGAVAYKKVQEGRLVKEQVRELKMSNDFQKEMSSKLKLKIDEVVEREAKNIQSKFYKSDDPETLERVKLAIREFMQLFEKGAEIYPSIDAEKKVRDDFPDLTKIQSIESKVKKIPNKK